MDLNLEIDYQVLGNYGDQACIELGVKNLPYFMRRIIETKTKEFMR